MIGGVCALYIKVAASSPAWLTRSALERKSRCAWVNGLVSDAGFEAALGPDFGIR